MHGRGTDPGGPWVHHPRGRLAAPLVTHLKTLQSRRRAEAFYRGEPMSPWVVCAWLPERPTDAEAQRAHDRIRSALIRTLKAAELPSHFTFHSTRHTYCSLLIAAGVSPVYAQQQAGHSDVSFTVRVYGSWFPVVQPGAVDAMALGLPLAQPVTALRGHTRNAFRLRGLARIRFWKPP